MTGIRYSTRRSAIERSNNPANPNKNVCAYAVAHALFVQDEVRYLHTWGDMMRAVRKLWSMRSVASAVNATKRDTSVGAVRAGLMKHAEQHSDVASYVVRVDGHVLLIGRDGKTMVDTDPRKRDRRKVLNVYGVYVKPSTRETLLSKMRAALRSVQHD